MSITYIIDDSEKLKCIAKRYNIITVFKTRHTLRNSFMRTGPNKCSTRQCKLYLQHPLKMWQELQWGNRQTMRRETQGTHAKLGSRSPGKIQTSTAFV
jgi:hypothetical protein